MISKMSLAFCFVAILATTMISSFAHAHLFKSEFVEELTPETIGKFLSSHHAAYLVLYAPWCGHCKSLVTPLQTAAKSMKGTVKFGAIDADKYKNVAQQYGVQGFPTIKKWAMGPKKGVQPSDFQGGRTAAAIQSDALSMIKHKTTAAVAAADLVQATAKTSLKKAFVLITDKDKVAPLYNVLSFSPHYDGKLAFVVVKTQNKKTADLVKLLGSPKTPAMLVVSLNEAGDAVAAESIQTYTGAVEYKAIAKYLVDVVKGDAASGTPAGEAASSSAPADSEAPSGDNNNKKQAKQSEEPKQPPRRALPVSVTPLTPEALTDFCSGNAYGKKQPFCVIMFHSADKGAVPEVIYRTFEADSVLVFTAFAAGEKATDDGLAVFAAAKESYPQGSPNTAQGTTSALVMRTTEKKVTKYLWVDGHRNQDLEGAIAKILDGSSRMNKGDGVFKF